MNNCVSSRRLSNVIQFDKTKNVKVSSISNRNEFRRIGEWGTDFMKQEFQARFLARARCTIVASTSHKYSLTSNKCSFSFRPNYTSQIIVCLCNYQLTLGALWRLSNETNPEYRACPVSRSSPLEFPPSLQSFHRNFDQSM